MVQVQSSTLRAPVLLSGGLRQVAILDICLSKSGCCIEPAVSTEVRLRSTYDNSGNWRYSSAQNWIQP